MMTREEFLEKKWQHEQAMSQTRQKQADELMRLDAELRMDHERIKAEMRTKLNEATHRYRYERTQIIEKYKQQRRDIWDEDTRLVMQWREQYPEITPPTSTLLQQKSSLTRKEVCNDDI